MRRLAEDVAIYCLAVLLWSVLWSLAGFFEVWSRLSHETEHDSG